MLHAPISETKKPMALNSGAPSGRWSPDKSRFGAELTAQSLYGNQAVLRTMRAHQGGSAVALNQSSSQSLARKSDCACGGQCSGGKGAVKSQFGFDGELEDGVFGQMPEEGPTAPSTDAPPEPTPLDTKDKPPSCTDVCDRAYKDPALTKYGGGVICDHGAKCPCVFDVKPLKRGQCADFDANVLAHEKRHLSEGDCGSDPNPHLLGPKDPSTLIPTECVHRKESIAELDKVIPNNKGDCQTGMQTIRDRLDKWVKANCK